MNSKQLIIILFFTFFQQNVFALEEFPVQQEKIIAHQDSLAVDSSDIKPRQFNDLKEKYSDDDFIYEYDTNNTGWWTRFKQWVSDLFKSWFNIKNSQDAADLTDWMLKIGAVLIFLFVAYFIFKAVMNQEGQWVFGKSSDKKIIPITDIETNLNLTDFDKLTKDAENSGEFRLAIRYYYLWLLKKLGN